MVYIPKGEHDDPHELHQQQELESFTEIEQTLYSYTDIISLETNSCQKLNYIYQHFQDNEQIHESDPNLTRYENDNTLYPHINNDIELEDPIQQHTLYTQEVDASLFTTDTATLCDYNITDDVLNSDTILESKSKITQPMGIHLQSKPKYRNVFGDSNIQYHDFNNGDALTFKDKYTALLQQELQNPYWCLHDPITTKSYQISSEMDIETMPYAMYFSGNNVSGKING